MSLKINNSYATSPSLEGEVAVNGNQLLLNKLNIEGLNLANLSEALNSLSLDRKEWERFDTFCSFLYCDLCRKLISEGICSGMDTASYSVYLNVRESYKKTENSFYKEMLLVNSIPDEYRNTKVDIRIYFPLLKKFRKLRDETEAQFYQRNINFEKVKKATFEEIKKGRIIYKCDVISFMNKLLVSLGENKSLWRPQNGNVELHREIALTVLLLSIECDPIKFLRKENRGSKNVHISKTKKELTDYLVTLTDKLAKHYVFSESKNENNNEEALRQFYRGEYPIKLIYNENRKCKKYR